MSGVGHSDETLPGRLAAAERRSRDLEARLAGLEGDVERRVLERTAAVERLNRALRTLSDATELFARETDPARILPGVCRLIVERAGHRLAYVGEARADGRLEPVAVAGASASYLSEISMRWDDGPLARGPSGSAIRDGRTRILVDARTDPDFAPWREKALAHGILSSITIPLPATSPSRVLGVYGSEPGFFDVEVTALLQELAARLAFALGAAEDRRARAESEELLRKVFEHAAVGIAVTDGAARIVAANPAFERILGYSLLELIGRYAPSLCHPEDLKPDFLREAVLASPHDVFRRSLRFVRKDGSPVPGDFTLSVIRGPGRSLQEGIVFFEETTERERSRAAVQELERVREQLWHAQRLEAIGRLAGGVAHDFNNLLTVIEGFTRLAAAETDPGGTVRPMLDQVLRASGRAVSLTRQLLTFSRRAPVRPRVFDLAASLRDMETMLRRVIGEDVELGLVCEPGEHLVEADPGQLEQVVMNLVVNARDAMPRGGRLTIRVGGEQVAEGADPGVAPGRHVALEVEDTGTGMDERVQARLFEPFFTTKEIGKGTGLGLATVYGIVQQARGAVRVESEVGKGSRFRVLLPRADAPGETSVTPPTPLPTSGGRETILLVEDDPGVREVVRQTLAAAGFRVLDVGDPTQALGVAEAHGGAIDLVLSDVIMPGLDGPSMVRGLRARFPRLRVVFMSGYVGEAVDDLGGELCLTKPVGPRELVRALRDVLDARKA